LRFVLEETGALAFLRNHGLFFAQHQQLNRLGAR
jgi:hypothetical protein